MAGVGGADTPAFLLCGPEVRIDLSIEISSDTLSVHRLGLILLNVEVGVRLHKESSRSERFFSPRSESMRFLPTPLIELDVEVAFCWCKSGLPLDGEAKLCDDWYTMLELLSRVVFLFTKLPPVELMIVTSVGSLEGVLECFILHFLPISDDGIPKPSCLYSSLVDSVGDLI